MLGGLCMTRKACRPKDDESPDNASGILSSCSTKCDTNTVLSGGLLQGGLGDEDAYILAMPRCRYKSHLTNFTIVIVHYNKFLPQFTFQEYGQESFLRD